MNLAQDQFPLISSGLFLYVWEIFLEKENLKKKVNLNKKKKIVFYCVLLLETLFFEIVIIEK